jgi:hypothetical protein
MRFGHSRDIHPFPPLIVGDTQRVARRPAADTVRKYCFWPVPSYGLSDSGRGSVGQLFTGPPRIAAIYLPTRSVPCARSGHRASSPAQTYLSGGRQLHRPYAGRWPFCRLRSPSTSPICRRRGREIPRLPAATLRYPSWLTPIPSMAGSVHVLRGLAPLMLFACRFAAR